jgi:hypothetical protein
MRRAVYPKSIRATDDFNLASIDHGVRRKALGGRGAHDPIEEVDAEW